MRFTFPFMSEDYAIGYRWTDLLMRETETQDPEDRMLLKSRVNYANKPKMGENFETGTFASFDTDIYSKIDEDYREYFPSQSDQGAMERSALISLHKEKDH